MKMNQLSQRAGKTFLLIAVVFLFISQMLSFAKPEQKTDYPDYSELWAKVTKFEKDGLPKSALEVVDKILVLAKNDKNLPQIYKAVVYKTRFEYETNDYSINTGLKSLRSEIELGEFPVKPLLQSLYAEILWNYYNSNRWEILDRTYTGDFIPEDIETYDARLFMKEISKNYLLSLENFAALQKCSIDQYKDIVYKNDTVPLYRTNLFDLLAYRAIGFFSNAEAFIAEPVTPFKIDNPDFFSEAKNFANMLITSPDEESLHNKALIIYQKILALHEDDRNPVAYIEADLLRLQFVRNNAVNLPSDSLYLNALLKLQQKYGNVEASTQINNNLANFYYNKGLKYNHFTNPEFQWDIVKARELCLQAIEKYPKAFETTALKELKNRIEQKSFTFQTENEVIPNKPVLVNFKYRNISSLNCKIINISGIDVSKKIQNMEDTARVKYFNSLPVYRTFQVPLPNENDYQEHSTEYIVPALPAGQYLFLASSNASYSLKNNKVDYKFINATSLSYIYQRNEDYSYTFYVLDRNTGVPIPKVKAETYTVKYNYNNRKYETRKTGTYTTDVNGSFSVPSVDNYSNFSVEFSYNTEKLSTANSFYQYTPYRKNKKSETRTFFFTDRSLYRPGQTLYFKGLVVETNGETSKIKPNFKSTVILYDANWQKVSELQLVTNEFGSYNGTFTLPSGGLTGQMSITDTYGTQYFSVEEYKRPTFEVKFPPIEKYYKLNQEVEVTGNASAYSGYAIDGATVSYSVSRSVFYPYRKYWMWYPPEPAEKIIKQGKAQTDDDGNFILKFIAQPDEEINKKYMPAFLYTVNADVTDINGETRSSSSSIYVGYKSMVLGIDLPEILKPTGKTEFLITSKNLNSVDIPAKVNISISKVQSKQGYYVSRPWQYPDRPSVSLSDFKKAFPLLPNTNEDQVAFWDKGKQVYNSSFNTDKNSKLAVPDIDKWESGWYCVKLTSLDPFGETIEQEQFFRIFQTQDKTVQLNAPFWVIPDKPKAEPGDKAIFTVGTSVKNASILVSVEHKQKIVSQQWYSLDENSKTLEFPVEEKHRGGFTVHFTLVADNRAYTRQYTVQVPHSNKELDIRFETFRDKLQPGQKEQWNIVVSGKNGEKVLAEMLAVMYDASLDAFLPHNWGLYLNYYDYSSVFFNVSETFGSGNSYQISRNWNSAVRPFVKTLQSLNTFGLPDIFGWNMYSYGWSGSYRGGYLENAEQEIFASDEAPAEFDIVSGETTKRTEKSSGKKLTTFETTTTVSRNGNAQTETKNNKDKSKDGESDDSGLSLIPEQVAIRQNFSETAFFYPDLHTNENGELIVSFTLPESLTKWKMLGLAHTKDLKSGTTEKTLVAQKDLMVVPNLPRFFREGDQLLISTKITNLAEEKQSGKARLLLFDAFTMQPIDNLFNNTNQEKSFTAEQGKSASVSWSIQIPQQIQAVACRIIASTPAFSDGEEHVIPVLTNRMLVTESLPLPIRSNQSKTFKLEKLLNSGKSKTMTHQKLTLEFTANPAWYAVQALPYMMEYPYECAEQIFSRYYSNLLATHIANSNPKIKQVFDNWKNAPSKDALLSNLEKNEDLKNVLLEETPWVLDAKNETERKNRVGLLFDLNTMAKQTDKAFRKLKKMQKPEGGWVWFEGFEPDRYITQHIISGFGHLIKLNVIDPKKNSDVWGMVSNGVSFIDNAIVKDYNWLKTHTPKEKMQENHLSYFAVHYLYARSFYVNSIEIPSSAKEAVDYYRGQAQKYWLDNSLQMQGMIALALFRSGDKTTSQKIITSLQERAIINEEMGMYWKENSGGYYWWQAPIETHTLLTDAFYEITGNLETVDNLRTWLLKMKQVQDWKTTKATCEAIYVLLMTGNNWLTTEPFIEITVGTQKVFPTTNPELKTEAGTGYFKTSWNKTEIKPEMGEVKVTKKDQGVSWGALYWQYFEQLDKITPAETPLKISKKLFSELNTDKGKELKLLTDNAGLKVGDKVIVRIEIRVDRDMEYVHLKDMRAAGLEPLNVLSGYNWKGGLGYYESTRDASTNFFVSFLPKGTYVFEYPLRASIAGNFSNGITTIQCMYAPEFTSHSEGIRIAIQ